jgi:hypothetical protein
MTMKMKMTTLTRPGVVAVRYDARHAASSRQPPCTDAPRATASSTTTPSSSTSSHTKRQQLTSHLDDDADHVVVRDAARDARRATTGGVSRMRARRRRARVVDTVLVDTVLVVEVETVVLCVWFGLRWDRARGDAHARGRVRGVRHRA